MFFESSGGGLCDDGGRRHDPTAAAAGAAAQTGEAPTAAPDSPDTAKEDKTGIGHVSLTGQYALEKDFVVSGCQVAPPGGGLLSGYHMTAKDGVPPIALLSITLKDYDKNASYVQVSPSREAAAGRAMGSGVMGPLTMMVMQGCRGTAGVRASPGVETDDHGFRQRRQRQRGFHRPRVAAVDGGFRYEVGRDAAWQTRLRLRHMDVRVRRPHKHEDERRRERRVQQTDSAAMNIALSDPWLRLRSKGVTSTPSAKSRSIQ
jgi:hypothetical protein